MFWSTVSSYFSTIGYSQVSVEKTKLKLLKQTSMLCSLWINDIIDSQIIRSIATVGAFRRKFIKPCNVIRMDERKELETSHYLTMVLKFDDIDVNQLRVKYLEFSITVGYLWVSLLACCQYKCFTKFRKSDWPLWDLLRTTIWE